MNIMMDGTELNAEGLDGADILICSCSIIYIRFWVSPLRAFLSVLSSAIDESYNIVSGDDYCDVKDDYCKCSFSLYACCVDTRLPEHKDIESINLYSPWASDSCVLKETSASPPR